MKPVKVWIPLLLAAGLLVLDGCQKKADLTKTETSGVMAETSVKSHITSQTKETTVAPTLETTTEGTTSALGASKPQYTSKAYQNDKVTISYPEFNKIKDDALTAKINQKLQSNVALALEAMKIDVSSVKMDVREEIISSNDKRISVGYTGTMTMQDGSTKNVFFTNNIDVNTGKDLGLSDFVDPQTMAGYILSNDVKLHNASSELTEKFLSTRHNMSYDDYVAILTHSDFPLDTDAMGSVTSFPQSFSYVKNGDIYFSIPVSADMGDYLIIVYSPDSK